MDACNFNAADAIHLPGPGRLGPWLHPFFNDRRSGPALAGSQAAFFRERSRWPVSRIPDSSDAEINATCAAPHREMIATSSPL